jgi:hypothetical protein
MLANYSRLVVFALGLLIGVQAPGFVDQYTKRVSAHQIEAARNFKGFQDIADQYFGGDVAALIAHHAASQDEAFKDEGTTIQDMHNRLEALTAELAALSGPLILQIIHVTLHPNREILEETRAVYSYTVPLNPSAVISGLITGTVLAILIETVLLALARLLRPRQYRSA